MFLSRFEFNKGRAGTRKLLANPHLLHVHVETLFPPAPNGKERILWRLDKTEHSHALLLVSPRKPDFTGLAEIAGWPASEETGWVTKPYDTRISALKAGEKWGFRLVAAPSKSVRAEGGKGRGKRVPLTRLPDQLEWLSRQAAKHGFEISHDEVRVTTAPTSTFTKPHSLQNVSLTTVTFEGALTITSADVFKEALTSGVGPAKGYGHGLLTIAPAN